MSRPYRIEAENVFYHITSRGDGRRVIFKGEKDYRKFLEYVIKAKKKYKFYLYAYVLMNNHYHLLIETTGDNISDAIRYLNSMYSSNVNVLEPTTTSSISHTTRPLLNFPKSRGSILNLV